MKEVEQEGHMYLGIVELDKIKESEMKEKTIKEYKRRLRLTLKSKLNGKNKITAIHTWAVAIFRCGAGVIDWKESELKSVHRKTRKTLRMYGAMHPKGDVDRLYIKRNDGGRGLSSVEYVVRGEENSLGLYVLHSEEELLRGVCEAGTIETDSTVNTKDFKKLKAEEGKEKFLEKKMHGQFCREMPEKVDKEKSWYWLSRGDVKVETEALLCAAQKQALRTNYIKHHIDKGIDSPCAECVESVEKVCNI